MAESTAIVLYFVFLFTGNICLFILLLTLAFVRSLPQRQNPLLLNLLVTTYLSTFPPMLLLLTGKVNMENPPKGLCLTQAILMDGIAPMFGTATLVLVFWTVCEIRAAIDSGVSLGNRHRWLQPILFFLPYFAFLCWSGVSMMATIFLNAVPEFKELISCANVGNMVSNHLRTYVGYYVGATYLTSICFEIAMINLVRKQLFIRKKACQTAAQVPWLNYQLALRLLALTCSQVMAALLGILLAISGLTGKSPWFFVIESLNALSTFLAFGTTTDIFVTWKLTRDQSTERTQDSYMSV